MIYNHLIVEQSKPKLSSIKKIDTNRQVLPQITTFLLLLLVIIAVWFFRGGSFRLYTSLFFGLYFLTKKIWASVILIGIVQNIFFLPLRIISSHFNKSISEFENELERIKKEDQQFLVFNEKIKKGNLSIIFYIFNFFVNAIAFFSAGRIFLVDFYSDPLKLKKMNLLYDFIPHPEYPLKGQNFHLPLLKITDTTALDWSKIFIIIGSVILFFTVLRFLWRLVRSFLSHNKKILFARIKYNRFLLTFSGFGGVLLILTIIFLRHIPIAYKTFVFIIDLSHRNIPLNTATAIGTFITTIHAGYSHNSEAARKARLANIPDKIIGKVFRSKMGQSFKNAIILGIGAFLITNNIPSAFELSILVFEVMYIIYPYTFGLIIKRTNHD